MSDTATMLDWQQPWHVVALKDAAVKRFGVIIAHRKAKKTLLAIKELDRWAQAVPAVYWHVFPTLSQGKKIVWDDPDMYARNVLAEAWLNRNSTDHYLQYPNGSKVYLIGAKGEDALRGPNPLGVVLDEYDDMGPNVWPVIQPIMYANEDAWCWFIGTFKGKKDLYAKLQFAFGHSEDWFGMVVKASESGIISPEALKDAKESTPQSFYDMEYECIPVESGTGFFTKVREHLWDGVFSDMQGIEYQSGADLAKYNDWTVLTPVEITERPVPWGEKDQFRVGMPERFNQIDWPLQKARIAAFWGRYNKGLVRMDRTGVGDPIVDDLKRDGVTIDPVSFTQQERENLLRNLSVMLANEKLLLPTYEPLLLELEAFSYDVNKTGRVVITVPQGQHDDCVMSLALAVKDIKKKAPEAMTYQTHTFHDNTQDLWNMDNPRGSR